MHHDIRLQPQAALQRSSPGVAYTIVDIILRFRLSAAKHPLHLGVAECASYCTSISHMLLFFMLKAGLLFCSWCPGTIMSGVTVTVYVT